MKVFFLLPGITTLFISCHDPGHSYQNLTIDTTIFHLVDGKMNEWAAQKFETDAATEIKYGADNDTESLYLALVIPNFHTQMKMMRQGMELYIDLKGKKKEGEGIDFPVKRDVADNNSRMNFRQPGNEGNNSQESADQKRANIQAKRAATTLNLISMKVFGFSDDPQEQRLDMPGSANIADTWDSTGVMNIEYRIPLSLFGNASTINKKNISIGWKLNGVEFSSNNTGSNESPMGGRRGGGSFGGGGGRRNSGAGSGSQDNMSSIQNHENMMKDQSFWTKYTLR